MRTRRSSLLLALALAAGCTGKSPVAPTAKRSVAPIPLPLASSATPAPAPPGESPAPSAAPLPASPTPAAVTGLVFAPAELISDHGGGLTSKVKYTGIPEVLLAGVRVTLETADGKPVLDARGQAYQATTAADGSYQLDFTGNTGNLVVRAALPGGKGDMLAILAKGVDSVDVDAVSSLATGYVLEQYVKGQQAILEKLPADVEAETRDKVAAGLVASAVALPETYTPAEVVAKVQQLRGKDGGVDAQMEKVRKILLAGLSNQGIGQPIDDLEISANRVVMSPEGDVVFFGTAGMRVFKKDARGRLAVVAGNGRWPKGYREAKPIAEENVPATEAGLYPLGIAYDKQGNLMILDHATTSVRKVDGNGIITTYCKMPQFSFMTDIDCAPDGSLRVSTPGALYSIGKDGKAVVLVGQNVPGPTLDEYIQNHPRSGEGGPLKNFRFGGIWSIGCDPTTGDTLVYDFPSAILRVSKDKVTREVGTGKRASEGGTRFFEGCPALETLVEPGDVAVDATGVMHLAYGTGNRLVKLVDGKLWTVAGTGVGGLKGDGGPAASAELNQPLGLCFAPDGKLVIAADSAVRAVVAGNLVTVIGELNPPTGPRPAAKVEFMLPRALRYEPATRAMLVADLRHIWRWRPDQDTVELVGSPGAAGQPFQEGSSPTATFLVGYSGLVLEPDGSLTTLATDPNNQPSTRLLNHKDNALKTLMGQKREWALKSSAPADVTAIPPNSLLTKLGDTYIITPPGDGGVFGWTPGQLVRTIGGLGTLGSSGDDFTKYYLRSPAVTEPGPDGKLYLAQGNQFIRIDITTQKYELVMGKSGDGILRDGTEALQNLARHVTGIAWDGQQRLYFSESDTGLVCRIEPDGKLKLVAGIGTALLAGDNLDDALVTPGALAFDGEGNLFVADTTLNQVKQIPKDKLP